MSTDRFIWKRSVCSVQLIFQLRPSCKPKQKFGNFRNFVVRVSYFKFSKKKKEKKAYLKPYYFDIFLKKGKTLKHPKEGEEREEFLLFFFFLEKRRESGEREKVDHPVNQTLQNF